MWYGFSQRPKTETNIDISNDEFTHVLICLWIQKQVLCLCFHDSDDFQLKICFLIDFWMRLVLPLFSFDKKIACFGLKPALIFENSSGMLIRDFSRFEEWKWSLHTTTFLVHKNANMKCKVTIQGLREKGVRLLVDNDPHSPSVKLPFSKLRIS